MATRNIVPRVNGEGSIGTAAKHWGAGHFDTLPNWQEYLAESTGYGIVLGCEPTISGLTVTVGAGIAHLADGTRKEIAQTNITLDDADSTNPRIDLVYIDGTGTVAKITGTAAASPSAPALPSGGIKVCVVTVAANASTGTVNRVQTIAPNLANYGVVNVKDFGAKGDGVTDDTAALQAAIDSGKKIILDGVFRITSPLLITKATNIQGNITKKSKNANYPESRILVDLHEDGTGIIVNVARGTKISVRDISILKKTDNTQTINAIKLSNNTSDSVFENITIGSGDLTSEDNKFDKGIVIEGTCWTLLFKQLSIYFCNSVGIDATNLAESSFYNLCIFDTPVGIKSTSSAIRITYGDFDKCHVAIDAYNNSTVSTYCVGAENYEATDGGLEKALLRSDGSVRGTIYKPSFYNNGSDTYNVISMTNGKWNKQIIVDKYYHNGFNIGNKVDSASEQGCIRYTNFLSSGTVHSIFFNDKIRVNGVYLPKSDGQDSNYGGIACDVVGWVGKHYYGTFDYRYGPVKIRGTSWGVIRHIGYKIEETIGIYDGGPTSTPTTFSYVGKSEGSWYGYEISATSGYFIIDVYLRSGEISPSDYPTL
jgi:hypothetical protein